MNAAADTDRVFHLLNGFGGIYEGRVTETTNDFVGLIEEGDGEPAQVFLFFHAIESITAMEASE